MFLHGISLSGEWLGPPKFFSLGLNTDRDVKIHVKHYLLYENVFVYLSVVYSLDFIAFLWTTLLLYGMWMLQICFNQISASLSCHGNLTCPRLFQINDPGQCNSNQRFPTFIEIWYILYFTPETISQHTTEQKML